MPKIGFKRYFTLEEAVAQLPNVQNDLTVIHQELAELRDSLILHKRILLSKQDSGIEPTDAEVAVLEGKFEAYEQLLAKWVEHFAKQGIILRDLETGLIDFPYHAKHAGQDYFLCWRLKEDGIFYFHSVNEGFSGRHPISLLPE